MATHDLPEGLDAFTTPAVRELKHVYDVNADRHDKLIGDDAIVFGVSIYRNSWYVLERIVDDLDGWTSARPDGSLVICGAGVRIHVYRYGQDEDVDLDGFRLDDGVSQTKRLIAAANGEQLAFNLGPSVPPDDVLFDDIVPSPSTLTELVIVHAGNPEDGCCGIWIGAPIPAEKIQSSPWYSIKPLWLIERSTVTESRTERSQQTRHDELPEPDIAVEPLEEPGTEEQSE